MLTNASRSDGLSPRVRGSREHPTPAHIIQRSIPTCAGQPGDKALGVCVSWVYPHVCGAAHRTSMLTSSSRGLSPRVRGSLPAAVCLRVLDRSIPTCAGQPRLKGAPKASSEVYPHVCGAARRARKSPPKSHGLSPRVRGSLGRHCQVQSWPRSIPTCAGQPLGIPAPPAVQ